MNTEDVVDFNTTDISYNLNIPYAISEVMVGVTAIIGNALVILVFISDKKLRTRTKYYILSLAIADFLIGLLAVPFAILGSVGLPTNINLCLFMTSVLLVLCIVSIFGLVAVSIDRYWAIIFPLSYLSKNWSKSTTFGMITACWVGGVCVGCLPLMGWRQKQWGTGTNDQCFFHLIIRKDYLIFLTLAIIILPCALMVIFYAHIYAVIIRQVKRRENLSSNVRSLTEKADAIIRVRDRKREVKITKNLSIIVFFFIFCWMPLFTINAIEAFTSQIQFSIFSKYFCIVLSHLNSSINPILYAYNLKDFRTALKNLYYGQQKNRSQAAQHFKTMQEPL